MAEPYPEFKIDPVSTEGLEDVFAASEASESPSEAIAIDSEVFGSSREVITTEEASRRLGISARAVINRLKAGKLAGQRVMGKCRTEWRIFWEPQNTSEEPSEIVLGTSERSEPEPEECSKQFGRGEAVALLLEQNQQLIEQVNALIYRNGYLEAKLEERESTIKLLTDSKQKSWSRFWSWFTGR